MGRQVTVAVNFRERQQEQFERVASALRGLEDDQLYELKRLAEAWLRDNEWFGDGYRRDPDIAKAAMELADVLTEEGNHRLAVVHDAESDLMGGHRVRVEKDSKTWGMWSAVCDPHLTSERVCWEGPDRAYVEDAIEDGRRHHPGHEPQAPTTDQEL